MARGFLLIREGDSTIYESKCAEKDDHLFLNRLLTESKIGKINECKRGAYVNRTTPQKYDYEVHIDPELSKDVLYKFIHSLFSIIHAGAESDNKCYEKERKWREFCKYENAPKVKIQKLEPFVARYIKSISASGIVTSSCCQGHLTEKPHIKVEFRNEFHQAWHGFLWSNIISKKFHLDWSDDFSAIPINQENQFDKYLLLNNAAAWMFDQSDILKGIRFEAANRMFNQNSEALSLDRFFDLVTENSRFSKLDTQ